VQEANAERAVAVAQQNVNSGTISKLEAEIARLKDELARSEQRAITAEEVRSYPQLCGALFFWACLQNIKKLPYNLG
jgi:hypothetical protein